MASIPPAAPKKRSSCLRMVTLVGGALVVLMCGFLTLAYVIGSRLPATPPPATCVVSRAGESAAAPTEASAAPSAEPTVAATPAPSAPTATEGPTNTPRPTWTPRPSRVTLTKQDLGDDWPLTVGSVELWCTSRREVVFRADDGTIYALNGTAKGAAKANGWEEDLRPIWLDDPSVPGLRISLQPLLDRGLELCQ